jgi:hypothetical protein
MLFGAFQPSSPHLAGCKRLLYFEGYEDICEAIAREKQLKGWRRAKKLSLIRTAIKCVSQQILLSASVVEKLRAAR